MERIEKALKGLLIQEPFYGVFCMNLNKSLNPSIETLRVGRKDLSLFLEINPDFFCSVSLEDQIQLLKHELLHICFGHLFSFQQSYLMNIAEDFEVNSYIKHLDYGQFPEDKGWERCKFEGNVFTTQYNSSYVEDLEEMVLLKKPFIFERDFLMKTQQFKTEPTLIEMKNLYSMLKSPDKDTVQLATSMLDEYAWFDYPKTFISLLDKFSRKRRDICRYLGKLNTEASMIVELFKNCFFDSINSKDDAADRYIAENLNK